MFSLAQDRTGLASRSTRALDRGVLAQAANPQFLAPPDGDLGATGVPLRMENRSPSSLPPPLPCVQSLLPNAHARQPGAGIRLAVPRRGASLQPSRVGAIWPHTLEKRYDEKGWRKKGEGEVEKVDRRGVEVKSQKDV